MLARFPRAAYRSAGFDKGASFCAIIYLNLYAMADVLACVRICLCLCLCACNYACVCGFRSGVVTAKRSIHYQKGILCELQRRYRLPPLPQNSRTAAALH